MNSADTHVAIFEDRLASHALMTKRHYANVKKPLANAFRWTPESRDGLIRFLRQKGWEVVQCDTEADLRIATDTVQGDIVISGDSDLFIYGSVTNLWRPRRGGGFLEYRKEALLSSLGFQHAAQLTALGVVSTNDYNRSIYGLGCETNYKVIKDINSKGQDDVGMYYLCAFSRR